MSRQASIVVIGREGQVARALLAELSGAGAQIHTLSRPDYDLARPDEIAARLHALRPTLVVCPAAYTAVDRAEDDAEAAHLINAKAPAVLAAAAAAVDAPFIAFSTDYVFDGRKAAPYTECDPTSPLGVYGATKLAGEAEIARANQRAIILRTAWVHAPYGANFVKTMLRLAAERPALRVVADQRGSPTSARDLARAVARISTRLHGSEPLSAAHWGTFHLTNSGETTWHGFAEAIMHGAARRGAKAVPVEAIKTQDYPTRARRPAHSVLDCARIARIYAIEMPPWQAGLAETLDGLLGPEPAATHT